MEQKVKIENLRTTVKGIDNGKIDIIQIIKKRPTERLSDEKYKLACFLGIAIPFFEMDSE